MRAKRSKKYRKIMATYQLAFSFREPYQVLLDSAFIRTCYAFHMPLQKFLDNTLHGQSRLFVTNCTLQKIMGEWEKDVIKQKGGVDKIRKDKDGNLRIGRPDWLPPPMDLPLRYCKHKDDEGNDRGVVSEAQCLLDLLAGQPHGNEHARNKQHYIFATADVDEKESRRRDYIDLRERARLIPGVPIVYVKRSVMILEELSGASEGAKRRAESERLRDGLVGNYAGLKRKRGADDEAEGDPLRIDEIAAPAKRGMTKAKGPNPLSVMKKRTRPTSSFQDKQAKTACTEASAPKAKRRRKHRSGKDNADTDAGGSRDANGVANND